MITESKLLERIDEILGMNAGRAGFEVAGEVYLSTINLASQLYGASSPQVTAVKQLKADVQASNWAESAKATMLAEHCKGSLKAMASDISGGRLGSLRLEYQGQIFADFINVAKEALENGAKDVAAVLACAALEDCLKRYGEVNGLEIEDEALTNVVNSLKAAGLLSAPQGALLKGMVSLRNKTFHAQWDKVDIESVRSVIAFVEQFIMSRYV